ncbi:hypothetical protein QT231_17615 [Halomonas sp. SpR1]|uniref:hypothetical protein n=1 Tax=Halomonas sp. SpR1 TaxID=3050462 RepID=UPI0027E4F31C|nr:hypothetical protein [Halomonas sp. SpR1]MDQ7734530.1 hypothetical protein [Halomonas sp. SpR1]
MLDQIARYMKGTWLKRVLVVNYHHGVLIVVIGLEARHADHSEYVFSNLPNLAVSGFFLQPQRSK